MFNKQMEFKFYDLYPEQIELPLDYSGTENGLTYSYNMNMQIGTLNTYAIDDITYNDVSINVAGEEILKVTDYGLVLKQESGWLKTKIGNWLGINYEK